MNETPNPTSDPATPPPLPPSAFIDPQYCGVGGWLLFFCLVLTLFSPLATLFNLVGSFAAASPAFARFPGLLAISVIDTLLSVGLMVFSIYAGIGLWRIQPGAVQTTKTFLKFFLGYLAFAAVLPFMAGLPAAANEAMVAAVVVSTVRGVIFFAIWNSYLNCSKRVKATYIELPM